LRKALIVLEQGANLGHATIAVRLADYLKRLSWNCVIAGPERHLRTSIIQNCAYRQVEIPQITLKAVPRPPLPWKSYATMLWDLGLSNDAAVAVFQHYQTLFAAEKPDVLILNAAPFAHLSSLKSGIPQIHIGVPFDFCPMQTPLPPFGQTGSPDIEQASAFEKNLIDILSRDLNLPQGAYLGLASMLQAQHSIVLSLPELDPQTEPGRHYIGNALLNQDTITVSWKKQGTKALAYLRASLVDVVEIAETLAKEFDEALILCPDISDKNLEALTLKKIQIVNEYINITQLLKKCDVMVSHAGGLIVDAVVNGVRQVVIPTQLEQSITANVLVKHGLALSAMAQSADTCCKAIEILARTNLLKPTVLQAKLRHQNLQQNADATLKNIFGFA
jgi:hypothetical protein